MESTPLPPEESAEQSQRAEAQAVRPGPVLITEQEVLLGSALTGGVGAASAPGWLATFRRIFVSTSQHPHRERPRASLPRCAYLENARMSREMGRL